jgi:aspartate/methionine/tyrosine aminotransferase
MTLMKAIQVNAPGADFVLVQKEIPEPKEQRFSLRLKPAESVMATPSSSKGIFPVYNIHEHPVTRLLVQLPSWVRNHITGRLGKGSGLVGVEDTVFGASRA